MKWRMTKCCNLLVVASLCVGVWGCKRSGATSPGDREASAREQAGGVDGPASWWTWLHAQLAAYGGDAVSARQRLASGEMQRMLTQASQKSGLTQGEVLREASRGKSSAELDELDWFARSDLPAFRQLLALARTEQSRTDLPGAERSFWGRMVNYATMVDPKAYHQVLEQLAVVYDAKDAARLKAFANDPMQMPLHRILASQYLALLGDASGLELFRHPEIMLPSDRQVALQTLSSLQTDAPAGVRSEVTPLVEKYRTLTSQDQAASKPQR
jgi:hypothetical protein